jgi:hypothetical protein
VVNAVLLRRLPYPEPDKLVVIREKTSEVPSGSVAYPNFLDWREVRRASPTLRWPGAKTSTSPTLARAAARLSASRGADHLEFPRGDEDAGDPRPQHQGIEDVPGAPPVVLISERLWKSHFGSARDVIGKQVVVDGISARSLASLQQICVIRVRLRFSSRSAICGRSRTCSRAETIQASRPSDG